MERLAEASVSTDGQPSAFVSFLGFAALVYYVFIWYIGITGLRQAQKLYGKSSGGMRSRSKLQLGLPLRHQATEVPRSPPPQAFHSAFRQPNPFASSSSAISDDNANGDHQEGGVSILRPLAGLDHNLASNLASAFEQRYPKHLFEVILSVHHADDQALRVAQTVCARYADVQSTIIVGDEPCGVNPKICNLVRPYAQAKFDIVWTLDAQVHVSPYALARAVNALQSEPRTPAPSWLHRRAHGDDGSGNARVGLAHHVPLGVTPHSTSFGSHVEATFLSTNHAKMYLAINAFSIESCVMGKSNLYRKSDLACVPDAFFNVSEHGTRGEQGEIGSIAFQQASEHDDVLATSTGTPSNERHAYSFGNGMLSSNGGLSTPLKQQHLQREQSTSSTALVSRGAARPLARFGIYLAEDNMLATALWKPPMNLAHTLIATDVARTSVGEVKSIRDYWNRRVRWIRVRRHMVPSATYIEPFTESILCGIIATWAFATCWLKWLGIVQEDEEYAKSSHFARLTLGLAFFLAHMLAWHFVDFAVLDNVQNAGQDDSSVQSTSSVSPLIDFTDQQTVLYFRLAWLCRELLAFPIWLAALCDNKVMWRGKRYKILSDSRAAHVLTPPSGNRRGLLSALMPQTFSRSPQRRSGYETVATSSTTDSHD